MNKVLHTKYGTARLNNKNGYFYVSNGRNKNEYLHRLIFEDFYGFKIPDGFVVHHKDGDKLNNCILNLQLLNEKEHSSLHHKGRKNSKIHNKRISESKKGYKHKESSKKLMSERHYDCTGKNNPRFLKHIPDNKDLYSENKRGATLEDLALKYNCGTATIQRRIAKYKKLIKNKPQLTTHGKNKDGKIMYGIRWNGEVIKHSVYKNKLIKWFEEKYGEKVIIF